MGDFFNIYSASVEDEMEALGEDLVPIVYTLTPKASRALTNSTHYDVEKDADGVVSLAIVQDARAPHNGEAYGHYVRAGADAHFPPIIPLEDWVVQKFGGGPSTSMLPGEGPFRFNEE